MITSVGLNAGYTLEQMGVTEMGSRKFLCGTPS
jgi:hypothetical protein